MIRAAVAIVTFALTACTAVAEQAKKVDLSVLYVGNASTPRAKAYADFLGQHFRKVETAERQRFDPKRAEPFDVVVLDWSQQDRPAKPTSPFGSKDAWNKPTVLLGSAGLLLAE